MATLIGRRIQHVEGSDPYHELTQLGDYTGPIMGYTGDRLAVFFLIPQPWPWDDDEKLPASSISFHALAHVVEPPHVFRECGDGSLEIRESILITRRWKGEERQWHGYLDEGHVWRTV